MATGAYALLNYLTTGGSGTSQVGRAISTVDLGLANLKTVVVDVEPCYGESKTWQAMDDYAADVIGLERDADFEESKSAITDPAGHIQRLTTPGTSGRTPPRWNIRCHADLEGLCRCHVPRST